MDHHRPPYCISTDPTRLDVGVIHDFLRTSYWARDIPRAVVERAIRHSLCFGVYRDAQQVGFGRAVSDRATFAYLADVFILPAHRGRGLAAWLVECVRGHPELQGLRRWTLGTRDAHGLYAKHGFTPLAHPEVFMEIADPDVYTRNAGTPL